MTIVAILFTGVCLVVMGLTAKLTAPDGTTPSEQEQARDRSLPVRRLVVVGAGMAAVLYGLYRWAHLHG